LVSILEEEGVLNEKKIAMGERVGALEQFSLLRQTACVHLNEREIIGYCHAFKKLFPDAKDFNQFLEGKAIPALIDIGLGRWYRDQITDLSLALSGKKKTDNVQDTKDILEE